VQSRRIPHAGWLDRTAAQNATRNLNLSDEEVLAIVEEARAEASAQVG
jgi:hypothetical protein